MHLLAALVLLVELVRDCAARHADEHGHEAGLLRRGEAQGHRLERKGVRPAARVELGERGRLVGPQRRRLDRPHREVTLPGLDL